MAIAPDQQRKRLGRGEVLQEAPPAPVTALCNCLESIKRDWKQQGSMAGLWQEWPRLAGPLLAPHCRPLNIRQGVLIIGASHPQWRQALLYNRPQLLAALRAAGHDIKDLRIQQHHPGSTPKLESEASIWARHPSRIDVHGMAACHACGSPAPAGEMALWGRCGFCRRLQLADPPQSESNA
ncbi:MAG: DUF721 domain-containing protein [Prochlorococcus sp. ALOHA_A2.0_51]|nr:DUF721 domain-containing protein [Prochlorococcus sp. ALOHA_A2.0_51]